MSQAQLLPTQEHALCYTVHVEWVNQYLVLCWAINELACSLVALNHVTLG